MMSFKRSVVLALVCGVAAILPAKEAKAQEKIALVSLQRALNEVDEGKNAKAKLKKDFEAKKKQVESMKTELETMGKDLEKQKMVLSQEALKSKTQEFQTKYMDMQTKAAQYEQELKTQEAQSAQKILESLKGIVSTISAQEGYTLVIENSGQTVLYSKTATDITPQVIAAFNKK